VRAGQRTLSQAERAAAATGVPASWLRAGGNIAVAGGDADVELVATAVTDALRTHSTGGPLALPFLCVQTDVAGPITDAIMAKLEQCRPAPLPAESLRDRALARIASLKLGGAHLLGGGVVPDDARHRMGWILPPTVLAAGAASHLTGAEPIGPVLTMLTWRRAADLAGLFLDPRYRQGLAFTWGLHAASLQAAALPHAGIVREAAPVTALADGLLPAAWTGGAA
jgi:acyl-CoA reductase-like NAD-dependent aldehyde dehydrogenase